MIYSRYALTKPNFCVTFMTMATSLYEVRVEDLVVRIERLGPFGRT